MTKPGSKISDTETEELRDQLREQPESGTAVMRLVAAREYKAGLTPEEIEDKYGWPEGTVYNWLGYIEERGIDAALSDKERSGRPSRLTDQQWEQIAAVLEESPQEVEYTSQIWSPELIQDYIKTRFEVVYSLRHIRRVMRRMGLRYRSLRPQHQGADPEEQEEFKEEFMERWEELTEEDYLVLAMDQTRQTMRTVRRHGWVQEGSEPRVEISTKQKDAYELILGAVTEDSDCFFCRTQEYLNRFHAINFLRALEKEFQKKIAVLCDQASYFTANDVQEFVENRAIELIYLPPKSPELNPMEGGWNQFKDALANRAFSDFSELRQAISNALGEINPPSISSYVCS